MASVVATASAQAPLTDFDVTSEFGIIRIASSSPATLLSLSLTRHEAAELCRRIAVELEQLSRAASAPAGVQP